MAGNTSGQDDTAAGLGSASSTVDAQASASKPAAPKLETNSVTTDDQWSKKVQAQLDWLADSAPQRRAPTIDPAASAAMPADISPRASAAAVLKPDELAKPDDEPFLKRLGNRLLRRQQDDITPSPDAGSEPKVLAEPKRELVDDIDRTLKARYTVVAFDQGKRYNLFEQGIEKPVITVDAKAISTTMDKGAVVKDVVTLARDRGWDTLKVSGTPTFKDEVWLEASKQGIKAQHEPSPRIQAEYQKWKDQQPDNAVTPGKPDVVAAASKKADLGQLFSTMSPEDRIADPRFRNAQLELMIANGVAEKETGKKIGQTPDIERALVAVVAAQLREGKVFDAPFLKPTEPVQTPAVQRNAQSATQTMPPIAIQDQPTLRQ